MQIEYERIRRHIASGVLLTTSIVTIFSVLGLFRLNFIDRLQFIPNEFLFKNYRFEIFVLLVLIIIAYHLGKGKRTAWVISIILLSLLLVLHLLHKPSVIEIIIPTMFVIYLVIFKNDYQKKGRLEDDSSKTKTLHSVLLFFLIVGLTFVFFNFVKEDFIPPLDNKSMLSSTLYSVALLDTTTDHYPNTKRAQIIVDTTTIFFITIYCYFSYLIIVYFWKDAKTHVNLSEIKKILICYGNKSVTCFAMMNDKSYFLDNELNSFISYKIVNGVGLSLGNPIGSDTSLELLILKFNKFCSKHDLIPAFYQISNFALYENHKFKVFKIGEEAIIHPKLFSLQGAQMKNLRNAISHAEKIGCSVQIFTKSSPIDYDIIDDISRTSQSWLKSGKKEIGFSCTPFIEENFENEFDILVLGKIEEDVLAFLTLKQYPAGNGFVLDFIRRNPNSPNGILELLIYNVINYIVDSFPDTDEFSLGLAGLSDSLRQIKKTQMVESVLFSIGKNLDIFYGYESLFAFKNKFNPTWESRYMAVPDIMSLPRIISSIYQAHTSNI